MADRMVFFRRALTGGGADALDSVDGTDRGDGNALQDLDLAFSVDTSIFYVHQLDAYSALPESVPDVIKPDTNAGDKRWILIAKVEDTSAYVTKATYNANTILAANTDDNPAALTIAEQTILGRITGGNIAALSAADVRTLLNVADGATAFNPAIPGAIGGTTPSGGAFTTLTMTTQSISDNAIVTIDSADAADDEYARFTANGIEGRTKAEVLADLMPAPGAIGETTPNTIRGLNKEIYKTATADSPLTAAQCSGTIVSNYGMTDADCIIDLPTASEGLSFVCILPAVRARYFRLRCPSAQSDKIYLNGVAGSDDGYVGVASGYVTGASCSMFTFKASDGGFDWFCIPLYGTWVAG
jgi:hypothetical protein